MAMHETKKDVWQALRQRIRQNKAAVLLSQISGQQNQHALVYPDGNVIGTMPQEALVKTAQEVTKTHQNQIVSHQDEQWFVQDFPEKTRMVIVGSAHISLDLIHLANQFNFETIVIDPRKIFTAETRFLSQPSQLYHAWPEQVLPKLPLNQDTYAVLLSHDPKIDDQALHALLRSEVAYIGCLGSRKTHAKRLKRLTEAGFSTEETDRIFAPVGVDIHAKTPQEIDLSVMAQVVEIKYSASV
jgi:xanthine dehydrogenase accessory factor